MTGRAAVREGSCPSVRNGRADAREGKCPFTTIYIAKKKHGSSFDWPMKRSVFPSENLCFKI